MVYYIFESRFSFPNMLGKIVRLLHVFCFLVDSPASGILNYTHQTTSKRRRCPDLAFIGWSEESRSTAV